MNSVTKSLIVLKQPLTLKDIKEKADEDNVISGIVIVEANEMYDHSYEDFLDILSLRLVNQINLMDIQWEIVGHYDSRSILVEVSGDVSEILNEEE